MAGTGRDNSILFGQVKRKNEKIDCILVVHCNLNLYNFVEVDYNG